MNRSIQFQKETVLNIGIHLTPTLAKCAETHSVGCNHSTQFSHQINTLWTVTQLLFGETNEN